MGEPLPYGGSYFLGKRRDRNLEEECYFVNGTLVGRASKPLTATEVLFVVCRLWITVANARIAFLALARRCSEVSFLILVLGAPFALLQISEAVFPRSIFERCPWVIS